MTTEPMKTYTERLVQVSRTFQLYPDRVVVHAKWLWRKPFETTVLLSSLKPDCGYLHIRYRLFKQGLLVLVIGMAVALLCRQTDGSLLYKVVEAGGWVIASLGFAVAAVTYQRVVFARFPPREGRGGLDIARSGPDRGEFEAFVKLVQRQIGRQRR
jgi:hypothetical protein